MTNEAPQDAIVQQYTELITALVAPLLDTPEQLEIAHEQRETSYTFTLAVHPAEVGRVIGSRGSSISAIREVVDAAAIRNGHRVLVQMTDD